MLPRLQNQKVTISNVIKDCGTIQHWTKVVTGYCCLMPDRSLKNYSREVCFLCFAYSLNEIVSDVVKNSFDITEFLTIAWEASSKISVLMKCFMYFQTRIFKCWMSVSNPQWESQEDATVSPKTQKAGCKALSRNC